MPNNLQKILFGFAVGDSLGVPIEFKYREFKRKKNNLNKTQTC